ncbi:hypothetical protein HG531_003408 [Fusarium graminearum]|nr:hypothetical protein HG531_003408 [Fusarium graminearum]
MILFAGVIHGHNFDDQTSPSSEMLCSLSGSRIRIILLPGKACFFPALVHCVDKILAQTREQVLGLGLKRAFLRGNILSSYISICTIFNHPLRGTHLKLRHGKIIHWHPHWAAPVVLASVVELILLAQAANTVWAPEVIFVTDEVQDLAQFGVVSLHETNQEGEQGNVALVAYESVLLVVVNHCITVATLLFRPVKVVEVVLNTLQVGLVLVDVFSHTESVCDVH